MTPSELSALHAQVFTTPRPWTADEFKNLLNDKHIFLCTENHGFLLGRVIAGEAELLTLAVSPSYRRQGIACKLMDEFLHNARLRNAEDAFLEVSSNNLGAKALYQAYEFAETGLRKNYYANPKGPRVDAIVMGRKL
jgi:ribosomal-protein-alanine N-acetyltransferase